MAAAQQSVSEVGSTVTKPTSLLRPDSGSYSAQLRSQGASHALLHLQARGIRSTLAWARGRRSTPGECPLPDTTRHAHLPPLSRFWSRSGLVLRLAVTLIRDMPGGRRLLSVVGQRSLTGPLRVLEYVHRCASAERHGQTFAMGTYHSAAMLRPADGDGDARLHTFGRGFHGQLGRGAEFEDSARPVTVRAFEKCVSVVAVHCGGSHCAVVRDAAGGPEVHTWGLASSGELGHGGWTPIEVCRPRLVASLTLRVRVRAVSTGSNHTLVVGTCGGLWACGRGRHGQTGLGHFFDSGDLQKVDALKSVCVTSVAAGGAHSLALTSTGDVWSWGDARSGQLGQGPGVIALDGGAMPVPQLVALPWWCASDPVVKVVAGGHHSFMLTLSGKLLACGRGRHGALGRGCLADLSFPEHIPARCEAACALCHHDSIAMVVAVSAGRDHTMALTTCGAVLATGCNSYGALGTGDMVRRTTFTRVHGLPRVVAIQAGEHHSAAASDDGRLFTWGRGDRGQLGHGETRSSGRPTELAGWRLTFASA